METGDRLLLQLLRCLLSNAVKLTPAGGRIGLDVTADAAGGAARIAVWDTGIGIAPEDQGRLFETLVQLDGRTERAFDGLGLGLALARCLAHLLRATIEVESTPGAGSVFSLDLPVAILSVHAAPQSASPRKVVGLPPGELRRRILVADDVAENREILGEMLTRVGFEVLTVNDGAQAVESLSSFRPHLVLMDLRMPGLNGIEAIRAIRTTETAARVPIVAVTASAFEEDRREVEAVGGDGFVSKPFREQELLETIGRALGLSYVTREHAGPTGGEPPPARPGTLDVPPPLREALLEAVVRADLDGVLKLAGQLSASDPQTAARIRDLAERYENDRLLALLSAAPRSGR